MRASRIALAFVACLLLPGAADRAAAGQLPAGEYRSTAVSDGLHVVAADLEATTVVVDERAAQPRTVALPVGCVTSAIGGGIVIRRCSGAFNGDVATDLATGADRWRTDIDPYYFPDMPSARRIGSTWSLYEGRGKGGLYSTLIDNATGSRSLSDLDDRAVLDADRRSGSRLLCSPLRRREDIDSLDEWFQFAAFDGRALLTYEGRRVLLERCGSKRIRVLDRAYGSDGALAAGIATWTHARSVKANELVAYDVRHRRLLGCAPVSAWARTSRHIYRSSPSTATTYMIRRSAMPNGRCANSVMRRG